MLQYAESKPFVCWYSLKKWKHCGATLSNDMGQTVFQPTDDGGGFETCLKTLIFLIQSVSKMLV